jgi:integrase
MPRLKNQLPKYGRDKRSVGSDRACVRIGGKKVDLGVWDSPESRERYDEIVREYMAADRHAEIITSGVKPTRETITIQEMARAYMDHAAVYYGPADDKKGTTYNLRFTFRILREQYGSLAVKDFGPQRLKRLIDVYVGMDHSRKTVSMHVDRIRRMFKWATAEELIDGSVYHALLAVSAPRKGRSGVRETEPVQPVDDKVTERTCKHLAPIVADMVRLQRLTGARPDEICRIRPCDIDKARDRVVWVYCPREHKTAHLGGQRFIALGPKAKAILKPYLDRPAESFCFSPREAIEAHHEARTRDRKTPESCGNTAGRGTGAALESARERYDTHSYRRAIHRACDRAFPAPKGTTGEALEQWRSAHRWSPNRIRHTAAAETLQAFDTETAQVKLGHSNIKTTQIYAGIDISRAIRAAKKHG